MRDYDYILIDVITLFTTIFFSSILSAGVFSTANEEWIVTEDKLMKISLGFRLICNKTCAIMVISCLMLSHRWSTIIISQILTASVFLTVNPGKNVTRDELMKISIGNWLMCNKRWAIMVITCFMLSLHSDTIHFSLILSADVSSTVNEQ